MERVWPAGAQSRTRFRTEIKHASRPLFSRSRRKLCPAATRRYSRRVRITSVIVNTRAKLHGPPSVRSLSLSLSKSAALFSKGKFIPPPWFASQPPPYSSERFPLYAKTCVPRAFCVDAVAMRCNVAREISRVSSRHFLRRQVNAKPFPRDYYMANFNASACILRFSIMNKKRE